MLIFTHSLTKSDSLFFKLCVITATPEREELSEEEGELEKTMEEDKSRAKTPLLPPSQVCCSELH